MYIPGVKPILRLISLFGSLTTPSLYMLNKIDAKLHICLTLVFIVIGSVLCFTVEQEGNSE